jgi:hypothetical protein
MRYILPLTAPFTVESLIVMDIGPTHHGYRFPNC